jgi:hypothetical protein
MSCPRRFARPVAELARPLGAGCVGGHVGLVRADSGWEWRTGVEVATLADIRGISATTRWKGETRTVVAIHESEDLVYIGDETVGLREVSPLVYSATEAEPGALPAVDILW